ncbi:PKD domain protein [compost metagenome]
MKKITLLFFMIVFSFGSYAQWKDNLWVGKQANNWIFYNNNGINFDTQPPSQIAGAVTSPYDDAALGCGTISDSSGSLLFSSSFDTLYDKNFQLMTNGGELISHYANAQEGLIIPVPNSNLHYVFHMHRSNNGFYESITEQGALFYSKVDMGLENGLGEVVQKNVLMDTLMSPKITAVHHADRENIWVVGHRMMDFRDETSSSNEFYAYLVSEDGISSPVISAVGPSLTIADQGQMKISPDGTKITFVSGLLFYPDGIQLFVFDFDNSTGQISNPIDLSNEINGFIAEGVEFSPNSQYLYVSEFGFVYDMARLHQFDLNAGDQDAILASRVLLAEELPATTFASLQLAPDGKIYMANPTTYYHFVDPSATPHLSIIHNPNNAGTAANFEHLAYPLENDCSFGLPGFIQSYFESGILYEGKCALQEVTFSTLRIPDITSISWDFGDPASGDANISSEAKHIFSSGGTYTVTATITSNNAQQIATVEVTIIDAPTATIPTTNLAKCADSSGNATFNLSEFDNTILNGQDASDFSVSYFANEDNLEANIPIESPNTFITNGQIVYAQVLNEETGCFKNIQFELIVNPLPTASQPTNIDECASNNGAGVFNLTSQNAIILGDQEDFEITYYTDEIEAQQGENPITDTDGFLSTGQTIYAVVTNPGTGCEAITQFELVVLSAPILGNGIEFTGCAPFDLEVITAEISTDFTLKFYETEEDALNQINPISDFNEYAFTGSNITLYISAENQEGCTAITQLLLQKGNCEIQKGISPNADGKNDFFDLSGFDVKNLKIFNRYGKEVYTKDNYTNQFFGQGTHGDDLPTGTYYYSIESNNGKNQTGWIYINR